MRSKIGILQCLGQCIWSPPQEPFTTLPLPTHECFCKQILNLNKQMKYWIFNVICLICILIQLSKDNTANYVFNYIFFGRGLYPTPTAIATGSKCRGELGGCTSALVSHLAAETKSVMEWWYTFRHLDGPISGKWPRYLIYE